MKFIHSEVWTFMFTNLFKGQVVTKKYAVVVCSQLLHKHRQNDRDHFRNHSSHASSYGCTEPHADSGVAHRSAIRQPHASQRHSAAAYARSATAAAHARSAIRQPHSTATPIG